MRYSKILMSTSKESVSNVDFVSQELLIRAGYIQQLAAGIFTVMHFGLCSFRKIEQIIREEMDRIGGVEISMPVVHPAQLWKQTGRYDQIDDSLVRFSDRFGREMVLGMTHEEVVSTLARSEIKTYKQLPLMVYQIQTKFRDEARARGGLIRVREFVMKDSYTFDRDWEGLELQYQKHYQAYFRIFSRTGLPVISIKSDVGMMGGKIAHEYMYLTEMGEDTIFICENTGYQANKEVASFKKPIPPDEPLLPIEKIHTPDAKTIAELANFLDLTSAQCGKVVIYSGMIAGQEKVIMAVIRGDMEVNKVKLQNLTKSKYLEPSSDEEISNIGAVSGYGSPINIDRTKALIIVDDLIAKSMNLVMGANEAEYHLKNVCIGRDYEYDLVGDIASAYEGALAPNAQSSSDILTSMRGIEVGNIFQLGTKYSQDLEALFMDNDGKSKPLVMGSYGIGIGRLLGCLAEAYHDDRGLKLPITVAPYEVHMVGLLENDDVAQVCESVYTDLQNAGIEILYDDRHKKMASPGEKFGDADLIGIPLRLTVSKRSLKNGGIELKLRTDSTSQVVPLDQIVEKTQIEISKLKQNI